MTYRAPIAEQLFVLEALCGFAGDETPCEGCDLPSAEAVLTETAKLAEQRLYPLNLPGDREGAHWEDGDVRLAAGFCDAYRDWVGGGWNGLEAPAEFGGQDLPLSLSAAVQEHMYGANVALSQIMSLTAGAIRTIAAHAPEEVKATYLPHLISGRWSGTMNLTEPQAGSDVGALRTMAVPGEDGSYRIRGNKIFITFGEHDAAENIVHLVLARTPDAPDGTRGISLFLVPKYLPGDIGGIGARNDVRCTAIEHKLGMRGSSTAALSFGDNGACRGYLIGERHGGMRAMFTMMNHARLGVGLQGVGIADIARQRAVRYASERIQSAPITGGSVPVRIVEHPDVRRMLMTLNANGQAARALAFYTSALLDRGHRSSDARVAAAARARADLLTPCTKAYCTDTAVHSSSMAIQVFGGAGFIEETGVAQHYRDARILPIYEGTNGIQALDMVRRKLRLDDGAPWRSLLDDVDACASALTSIPEMARSAAALRHAATRLRRVTERLLDGTLLDAAAAASPYLRMFSLVVCGMLMGREAMTAIGKLRAGEGEAEFLGAKVATSRYYLEQMMSEVLTLDIQASADSNLLLALTDRQLAY